MPTTPSLAEVMHLALESRLLDVFTAFPAHVAKVYDEHKGQYIDVTPALKRPLRDGEGALAPEAVPAVHLVPVAFPQGGPFSVTWPLAPGDLVLVVCAQWSLDTWIQQAKKGGEPVLSPDTGTHRLEGAIALPFGPAPLGSLLEGFTADTLTIAETNGAKVEIAGGEVHVTAELNTDGDVNLGERSAADYVALAAKVDAEISRLDQALNTLKAAASAGIALAGTSAAGAPTGPAAQAAFDAATATVPGSAQPTAASKVKAT